MAALLRDMAELDPSIITQIGTFNDPRRLADGQVAQIDAMQAQQKFVQQNMLRKVLGAPGALTPDGMVAPQAIQATMKFDPQAGFMMQKHNTDTQFDQYKLKAEQSVNKLKETEIGKMKVEFTSSAFLAGVKAYDDAIKAGRNPNDAAGIAASARNDYLAQNGGQLSQDEESRLAAQPFEYNKAKFNAQFSDKWVDPEKAALANRKEMAVIDKDEAEARAADARAKSYGMVKPHYDPETQKWIYPPSQGGKVIGTAEATSIATDAGFKVTDGARTRDQQQWDYDHLRRPGNPVAKPGTSAHERDDAVDIAFGPGVTPESIKAAYAAKGVQVTKILKEAGHYHVQWDKPVRHGAEGATPQHTAKFDDMLSKNPDALVPGTRMTYAAVDMEAQRIKSNPNYKVPGLGQGKAGANAKMAIENRLGQLERGDKQTGGDMTTRGAEVASDTKSLAALRKQTDAIVTYEKTALANMQAGIESAIRFAGPQTVRALRQAYQAGATQFNDPKMGALNVALTTAGLEYQRVIGGSGNGGQQLTDAARREALDLISSADSVAALRAKFKQMKIDMDNRRIASENQIKVIEDRLGGKKPKTLTDQELKAKYGLH